MRRLLLAVVAALPTVALGGLMLASNVALLVDPCATFGHGASGSASISPNDPCAAGASAVGLSRLQHALITGTPALLALVGGLAGAWGIARDRSALTVGGAYLVVPAMVLLMFGGTGVFVLATIAVFLVAARGIPDFLGATRVAARGLGALAGAAAMWVLVGTVAAVPGFQSSVHAVAFLVLQSLVGLALAVAAWATWWPIRAAPPTRSV